MGTLASLRVAGDAVLEAGNATNRLFLATSDEALLRAAALVRLWRQGYVEPVQAPPEPYHILARQLMALCLQERGIGRSEWAGWLEAVPAFSRMDRAAVTAIVDFMVASRISDYSRAGVARGGDVGTFCSGAGPDSLGARVGRIGGLDFRQGGQVVESRVQVKARDVFIAWEKWLRPAYNLILAAIAGMVILSFTRMGYPVPRGGRTVFHFVSRAIAANILFTAGPLADSYVSALAGRRFVAVTGLLFALGTMLSALIVPISVSWYWATRYPSLGAID